MTIEKVIKYTPYKNEKVHIVYANESLEPLYILYNENDDVMTRSIPITKAHI